MFFCFKVTYQYIRMCVVHWMFEPIKQPIGGKLHFLHLLAQTFNNDFFCYFQNSNVAIIPTFSLPLTLFGMGGGGGGAKRPPNYKFFPCNFYKRKTQPPKISDFQFQLICHTGVKFQGHTQWQSWFFWSNSYKIEVMITFLIEMLELTNFCHMTTYTVSFESRDKSLLVTSQSGIMIHNLYFKISLF